MEHPYGGGPMTLTGWEAWQWIKPRLNNPWWRYCFFMSLSLTKEEKYHLSQSEIYSYEEKWIHTPQRKEYRDRTMRNFYLSRGLWPPVFSIRLPLDSNGVLEMGCL
jgi:hypothetical protein